MKTTKGLLIKRNAVLEQKIEAMVKTDLEIRETLSELLDSYEYDFNRWDNQKTKKIDVKDWLGIAFLIGELKADADYAIVLESKKRLSEENLEFRRRIEDLQNSKSTTPN